MRSLVVSFIVVAGLLLGAFTCLVQVNETEYAIVARFGDPRRVIQPGRSLCEMASPHGHRHPN